MTLALYRDASVNPVTGADWEEVGGEETSWSRPVFNQLPQTWLNTGEIKGGRWAEPCSTRRAQLCIDFICFTDQDFVKDFPLTKVSTAKNPIKPLTWRYLGYTTLTNKHLVIFNGYSTRPKAIDNDKP